MATTQGSKKPASPGYMSGMSSSALSSRVNTLYSTANNYLASNNYKVSFGLNDVTSGIKSLGSSAYNTIDSASGGRVTQAVNTVKSIGSQASQTGSKIVSSATKTVSDAYKSVDSASGGRISGTTSAISSGAKSVVKTGGDYLGSAYNTFSNIGTGIKDTISGGYNYVMGGEKYVMNEPISRSTTYQADAKKYAAMAMDPLSMGLSNVLGSSLQNVQDIMGPSGVPKSGRLPTFHIEDVPYTVPGKIAELLDAPNIQEPSLTGRVMDWLRDPLGTAGGAVNEAVGAVSGAVNAVINIATDPIANVLSPISGHISTLLGIVGTLASNMSGAVTIMKTAVDLLPGSMKSAIIDAVSSVGDMVRPYWEGITATYNDFAGKVTKVLDFISTQLPFDITKIGEKITQGFDKISETWSWVKTNVLDKLSEYMADPGKLANDIWGYLVGKFQEVMTWVSEKMEEVKQWYWDKAMEIIQYTQDNWKQFLLGLLPTSWSLALAALYEWLTSWGPALAEWVTKAAKDPQGVAQELWDTAQEYARVSQAESEKMLKEWCQEPLGRGA